MSSINEYSHCLNDAERIELLKSVIQKMISTCATPNDLAIESENDQHCEIIKISDSESDIDIDCQSTTTTYSSFIDDDVRINNKESALQHTSNMRLNSESMSNEYTESISDSATNQFETEVASSFPLTEAMTPNERFPNSTSDFTISMGNCMQAVDMQNISPKSEADNDMGTTIQESDNSISWINVENASQPTTVYSIQNQVNGLYQKMLEDQRILAELRNRVDNLHQILTQQQNKLLEQAKEQNIHFLH